MGLLLRVKGRYLRHVTLLPNSAPPLALRPRGRSIPSGGVLSGREVGVLISRVKVSQLGTVPWASPGFVDTPNRTKSAIGVSHGEEAAAAIVLAGVQGGSDQGGAGEREECQHRGA